LFGIARFAIRKWSNAKRVSDREQAKNSGTAQIIQTAAGHAAALRVKRFSVSGQTAVRFCYQLIVNGHFGDEARTNGKERSRVTDDNPAKSRGVDTRSQGA